MIFKWRGYFNNQRSDGALFWRNGHVGPKVELPFTNLDQIVDTRWVPEVEKEKRYPLLEPEAAVSITVRFKFVNTLHGVCKPKKIPKCNIVSLESKMIGNIPF